MYYILCLIKKNLKMKKLLLIFVLTIFVSTTNAQSFYFEPETLAKNVYSMNLSDEDNRKVFKLYVSKIDETAKIFPNEIKSICKEMNFDKNQSKTFFESFFKIPTCPQGYYYAHSGTISFAINEYGAIASLHSTTSVDGELFDSQLPFIMEAIARKRGVSLEEMTLRLEASEIFNYLKITELLIKDYQNDIEVANMYAFFLYLPKKLEANGLFLNSKGRVEMTEEAKNNPLYKTKNEAYSAWLKEKEKAKQEWLRK